MTGAIPTEAGLLGNLQLLDASSIDVAGEIPTPLCTTSEEGLFSFVAS